jgi:hypothetical protein
MATERMATERMATGLWRVILVVLPCCWSAGCGGDDTGTRTDVPRDADVDTPTDTPADVEPETATRTYSACLRSCGSPDDCCLDNGFLCGDYSNRWSCDTTCVVGSCIDDAECVSWAEWIGLPGAAGYKCRAGRLYYTASTCVPGCAAAADCCPAGTDCSVYPQRRSCDAGTCKVLGCEGDTECRDWATAAGAANPANWVCRTPAFRDTGICTVACTTTDDCCPGGCAAYPLRLACVGGNCVSSCLDDAECRTWATGAAAPNPAGYVCRSFTF